MPLAAARLIPEAARAVAEMQKVFSNQYFCPRPGEAFEYLTPAAFTIADMKSVEEPADFR